MVSEGEEVERRFLTSGEEGLLVFTDMMIVWVTLGKACKARLCFV
jgi:hypothetical protein